MYVGTTRPGLKENAKGVGWIRDTHYWTQLSAQFATIGIILLVEKGFFVSYK
jgi:hypothetical protein